MNKLIGHFRTITKHRHAVIRNCCRAGILWQGLRHDLSKYSPTEFIPAVKYYVGHAAPKELERMDKGYIPRVAASQRGAIATTLNTGRTTTPSSGGSVR